MANKKPVRRKRAKATPRRVRKPKAVKDLPLTKLDVFYIEMKMVFDAAKKAGFDDSNALRIAYDREAYPDWIVPADDPVKKIAWEDGEEDV